MESLKELQRGIPLTEYCRGCMKYSAKFKDLYKYDLLQDFFNFTFIKVNKVDGLSTVLCEDCHSSLVMCRNFRQQCRKADLLMRMIKYDNTENTDSSVDNQVYRDIVKEGKNADEFPSDVSPETVEPMTYSLIEGDKLLLRITPRQAELLKEKPCEWICPSCDMKFRKINLIADHISKFHVKRSKALPFSNVVTKFCCPSKYCMYNADSTACKYFPQMKLLKQHYLKVHATKQFECSKCLAKFPSQVFVDRHEVNCGTVFQCSFCEASYKTNETLLVHLMRKHPKEHRSYLNHKQSLRDSMKRTGTATDTMLCGNSRSKKDSDGSDSVKKRKMEHLFEDQFTQTSRNVPIPSRDKVQSTVETQTFVSVKATPNVSDYLLDSSPKRTFATQTICSPYNFKDVIDASQCVKNDINLGLWTSDCCNSLNVTPKNSTLCRYDDTAIMFDTKIRESPAVDAMIDKSLSSNKPWKHLKQKITPDAGKPNADIETQTALDELVYTRFLNTVDESTLSEMISLSDIQTQTPWSDSIFDLPVENKLLTKSGCYKSASSDVPNSLMSSPDLSFKETQTCFCFLDSPKGAMSISGFGFPKLPFDSANASPMLCSYSSIETQTSNDFSNDFKYNHGKSDVFLSFSTTETQTCFDSSDSMDIALDKNI